MNNLDNLPEDIYIFDTKYEWTLILTHEFIDDKRCNEGDISNFLTLNLYTYVTNNPLIYVDPSGYEL